MPVQCEVVREQISRRRLGLDRVAGAPTPSHGNAEREGRELVAGNAIDLRGSEIRGVLPAERRHETRSNAQVEKCGPVGARLARSRSDLKGHRAVRWSTGSETKHTAHGGAIADTALFDRVTKAVHQPQRRAHLHVADADPVRGPEGIVRRALRIRGQWPELVERRNAIGARRSVESVAVRAKYGVDV